jgi:alpha-tubulin suppressor-like RCC1 family protein
MRHTIGPRRDGRRRWAGLLAAAGAIAAALTFLPQPAGAATGGTLFAWGLGGNGQLGNGTTTDRHLPTAVKLPAGTAITQVRAGCFHSLALTSTGKVFAWGLNNLGQLGNGTTTSSTTPVQVKLPATVKVTAVRAGCFHSLALTSTGTVYAWGGNGNGQLGNGTTTDSDVPVPVPTGTAVKAISAGEGHSLAVTTSGNLLAWGFGAAGQLGDGTADQHTPTPVPLPAGVSVTGVAAGQFFSLAVTSTGAVFGFGQNDMGELGNGTMTSTDTPVMAVLPPGTSVRAVTAGCQHTLAITRTGTLLAWGTNGDGQLGTGVPGATATPMPVSLPGGATVTAATAGCTHSMALTSNGRVFAWGSGANGRLGNGGTGSRSTPVRVKLPTGLVATAVGSGPLAEVSFAVAHK